MMSHLFLWMLSLMCIGTIICSTPASADREDWKVLQEDSYHNTFSYDAASVQRTAGNTVRVSAKSNGALYLYEIDCKNKRARIIEGSDVSQAKWFAVTSGSGELLLFNALCP